MIWSKISRRLVELGAPLLLLSLVACGAGMTPLNGGPLKGSRQGPMQTFEIDCRDTPVAEDATSIIGNAAGRMADGAHYYASCTYEGKPLSWKLLGVLHAGVADGGDWTKYREGMAKKADRLGCPAVALRRFPVTVGDRFEGVGALCVDPSSAP